MKNEEFLKFFKEVVSNFNSGNYKNAKVSDEHIHKERIQQIVLMVHADKEYITLKAIIDKPKVKVIVTKGLLEFWIEKSPEIERFYVYAKPGKIKIINDSEVLVVTPNGSKVILSFP